MQETDQLLEGINKAIAPPTSSALEAQNDANDST